MTDRYGERRDTPLGEPAPTITSKARTARWYDRRQGHTDQGGVRTMVRLIPDSEPAPTISGESESRDKWVYVNGNQENAARRSSSAPAPTVHFGAALNDVRWVDERPATTVATDPRVFQPGGHHEPGEQSQNAVTVTVTEAAVLQSFPPDYPWQGSRTAKFTQIGNAVPPLMARAVIAALLASVSKGEVAA